MDEYSVSMDPGNWGGKAVAEDREVVIQNVAVPYSESEDELRSMNMFSGDADIATFGSGEPMTESAVVGLRGEGGVQRWLVGAAAEQQMLKSYQQTTYSRYGTDEWYALIGALLAKLYPKRSGTIGLTVSIPVSQIRTGRTSEIRELLSGLWQLEYEGRERNYEIRSEAVDVVPEGFGSLVYLCISASGRAIADRTLAESRVVVFDFGGYTLDVMTFRALGKGPFNESIDSGLIHVRNTVEREIMRQFNRGRMTASDLDKIIRTGQYRHAGGEANDVSETVQDAMVGLTKDALRIWREDLNGGADFDTVVITGGGGPVIGPLLAAQLKHNDIRILPAGEAHVANVRGGLRYRYFKRQYTASS